MDGPCVTQRDYSAHPGLIRQYFRRILTLEISVKLIDAYNVTSQMIFAFDIERIDFLYLCIALELISLCLLLN